MVQTPPLPSSQPSPGGDSAAAFRCQHEQSFVRFHGAVCTNQNPTPKTVMCDDAYWPLRRLCTTNSLKVLWVQSLRAWGFEAFQLEVIAIRSCVAGSSPSCSHDQTFLRHSPALHWHQFGRQPGHSHLPDLQALVSHDNPRDGDDAH